MWITHLHPKFNWRVIKLCLWLITLSQHQLLPPFVFQDMKQTSIPYSKFTIWLNQCFTKGSSTNLQFIWGVENLVLNTGRLNWNSLTGRNYVKPLKKLAILEHFPSILNLHDKVKSFLYRTQVYLGSDLWVNTLGPSCLWQCL